MVARVFLRYSLEVADLLRILEYSWLFVFSKGLNANCVFECNVFEVSELLCLRL